MTGPDAPPEPGANPLDTPEVRTAMRRAIAGTIETWGDDVHDSEDAEERAIADVLSAILVALAPHVAVAQRAAFRAGVETAAGVRDAR